MTVRRRRFLQYGLALAGTGAGLLAATGVRADAAAGAADAPPRRVKLVNLHTAEELETEYAAAGGYDAEAMAAIARLLRDFRSGEQHAIDPMLLDVLFDVAAAAGADPVFGVISGYRSPQTNELLRSRSGGVALRSLHMEGRAIDVRLIGVACTDLAACGLGLGRGGVGFYDRSDFVHLDTGAVRSWRG